MSKKKTPENISDRRAFSFVQAVEAGYNPSEYFVHEGDDFPQGEFVATLDFKVWTKKAMGLGCYFTLKGGRKIVLTAFRVEPKLIDGVVSRYNGWYAAQDCVLDMSRPDMGRLGRRFLVEIGATATNRPKWLRCVPFVAVSTRKNPARVVSSSPAISLPLSTRTNNLLVGMISRSDLKGEPLSPEVVAKFSRHEIQRIVGMGEKTFREVARWLKRHELDFAGVTAGQARD